QVLLPVAGAGPVRRAVAALVQRHDPAVGQVGGHPFPDAGVGAQAVQQQQRGLAGPGRRPPVEVVQANAVTVDPALVHEAIVGGGRPPPGLYAAVARSPAGASWARVRPLTARELTAPIPRTSTGTSSAGRMASRNAWAKTWCARSAICAATCGGSPLR